MKNNNPKNHNNAKLNEELAVELKMLVVDISPLIEKANYLIDRIRRRSEIGIVRAIEKNDPHINVKNDILDAIEKWISNNGHWSDYYGSYKNAKRAVNQLKKCKDLIPEQLWNFSKDEEDRDCGDPNFDDVKTYAELAEALIDSLDTVYFGA